MPDNNPVENLFSSFCKQLLGVQKQTTNVGVLLELGEIPLVTLAQRNAIKNWVRIVTNENCNENIINSYQTAILENLPWSTNVEKKLTEIGMRDLFISEDRNSHLKAFQRLVDIFNQESLTNIQRNDGKLRTYGLLKTQPGFENYLTDIKSVKERTALTKIRLSNHSLMIEKGRHQKLDKNQRFCPFCPDVVEDEIHFLLKCKTYHNLRRVFLADAEKDISVLPQQSDVQQFCSLINLTPHITSQFLYRALELREFILRKHRPPD